jgi:2'-5' RNA ligase
VRANWFIGVHVPARDWFARVPDPPRNFRRFPADDLHLTVAFLGMVDEAAARAAWQHAARFPAGAIDATLAGVVPMGNPRRYSALSAELDQGQAALAAAISLVRDAMCQAAGAASDTRPPRPHVTLARPNRRATPDDRRAGLAWARELALHGQPVRLERLVLYTWSDDRTERLFRVVESRPFA